MVLNWVFFEDIRVEVLLIFFLFLILKSDMKEVLGKGEF